MFHGSNTKCGPPGSRTLPTGAREFSRRKYQDSGDHTEPVTIADYGSQAIICRALQTHYPDDAVVSEESSEQFMQLVAAEQRAQVLKLLAHVLGEPVGERELVNWLDFGAGKSARRTWVIDPIDGTKGFIAQRHYAIACGLLLDGQVAEGMVAAPGYAGGAGALFYTQDGAAWREPLAGGAGCKISVSGRHDPQDFVAVQSFARAHASKSRMSRAREYAGLGAARILELDSMEKYALVACGDADLYLATAARRQRVRAQNLGSRCWCRAGSAGGRQGD